MCAPGAGKTTLLLELAQHLLDRAAQDPEHPIPVVFPLSSWVSRRRPLADWLVDALHEQYDIPRNLGQEWIETDQILPLLDGLDEVAQEHHAACVEAINTFRQDHGLLPLVVCSRMGDYETLGMRLRLQGALRVRPLTRAQVDSYLAQVGAPLTPVRQALQEDPMLWELLDTPLMLTIVTLAYAGQPAEALRTRGTLVERRQSLFSTYVARMFQRRSAIVPYTRQQTEHWLAWLAWQMTQHDQTVFYLEHMQPDWLPNRVRWIPTKGSRLVSGLFFGLFGGLFFTQGPWLLSRLLVGLFVGLLVGLSPRLNLDHIISIGTLRWSWSTIQSQLRRILGTGLFGGLLFGLFGGLFFGQGLGLFGKLLIGLLIGLGIWLLAGLHIGLMEGLAGGEIDMKTVPNQGIRRSAWNALLAGLLFGLGIGLVNALITRLSIGLVVELRPFGGLVMALFFGLSGGLHYGGFACLQHLMLRLVLVRHDYAPWHYVAFLDYAAERIFLRKVGGGYIFIHRLLQDHFAALHTDRGDAVKQDASG